MINEEKPLKLFEYHLSALNLVKCNKNLILCFFFYFLSQVQGGNWFPHHNYLFFIFIAAKELFLFI